MKSSTYIPAIAMLCWLIGALPTGANAEAGNISRINKLPQALTIGDQLPDAALVNIVNATYTQTSIAQLKGKAIVLDFFGTYCGSCVEELPRLNKLQQQMGKDLQILVVTNQSA